MSEQEQLNEITVEVVNDLSGTSRGPKRRRKGKLRSKAWEHFTKLVKDDGTVDKCQCNHCLKLFTCAGKIGTTHLLRHITEGSCPVHNKDKRERSRRRKLKPRAAIAWKNDDLSTEQEQEQEQPSQQQSGPQDEVLPLDYEYLECEVTESFEDDYGIKSPMPIRSKLPITAPAFRSQNRGSSSSWMNELRSSVGRLVELTNIDAQRFGTVVPPDYSLAAAIKCLNEMEDIPQSSEMYLDAFEIFKDEGDRECFISLPLVPRRRWMQRMLIRQHPLRYNHDS